MITRKRFKRHSQNITNNPSIPSNETSVHKLDDYSLIEIFNYLTVVEKINIERVCRRWKNVSKDSWSSYKKLDLDAEKWGFKSEGYKHEIKDVNLYMLESVLSRCGKYLTSVDFNAVMKHHYSKASPLPLIAKYCKNIKSITAEGEYSVSLIGLKHLSRNCKNITELKLKDFNGNNGCDIELSRLFDNNKNLKSLKISGLPISGKCLSNLSTDKLTKLEMGHYHDKEVTKCALNLISRLTNLTSLKYHFCCSEMPDLFNALKTCRNITELYLLSACSNYKSLTDYKSNRVFDNFLSKLFENNNNLKILTLSDLCFSGECLLSLNDSIEEISFFDNVIFDYRHLANRIVKLKKLHTLKLHYAPSIENLDKIIGAIKHCAQLKNLRLSGTQSLLKEEDLNFIYALTNLEVLNLDHTQTVTEIFLENIKKKLLELTDISLVSCNLTDKGLLAITSLPNLIYLNVSKNKNITHKGFSKLMSNITILRCMSCNSLNNNFANVIKNYKKLIFLDLYDSLKINNTFVNKCINFTKDRKNSSHILTISLEKTNVDIDKIKKKSQHLELMFIKCFCSICIC